MVFNYSIRAAAEQAVNSVLGQNAPATLSRMQKVYLGYRGTEIKPQHLIAIKNIRPVKESAYEAGSGKGLNNSLLFNWGLKYLKLGTFSDKSSYPNSE